MGASAVTAGGHDLHDHHHEHPPAVIPSTRMHSGMLGMLFFIGSEIALFGSFFMAYFFIRVGGAVEFEPWYEAFGHAVPVPVAAINTVILLSSSVTLHVGLNAIKKDKRRQLAIWTAITLVLGLTFFGIQVLEYGNLLAGHGGNEGFGPSTNAYSTIFFCLTGLHGSHVLVGAALLSIILVRALRGHYSAKEHHGLEAMGVYWHFVDVVWVFVFSAFYLTSTEQWVKWFS